MAINRDSNVYTFIFAVVMVTVVGALLAFTAIKLKPLQDENISKEKKQNILSAIQVEVTRDKADDKFNEYVIKRLVIDFNGNVISENTGDITDPKDAFNIDVKKEYKTQTMTAEDKNYPLFICEKEGSTYYVIPMVGTGLWGPIWGYVALKNDYNTVYGASFDHKTETPGLGAEINKPVFTSQFPGKEVLNENGNVAIRVIKPGAEATTENTVDGITGGTITSQGVGEMLDRTFKVYQKYFKSL